MNKDLKLYLEGVALSVIFMVLMLGLLLLNVFLMFFPKVNLVLPNMFLRSPETAIIQDEDA